LRDEEDKAAPHVTVGDHSAAGKLPLYKLAPWLIVGFLVLAELRSADVVPHVAVGPMAAVANLLTIVSIAALGLGTDIKVVAKAGMGVTAAVALSLLTLGAISIGLIRLLGIA